MVDLEKLADAFEKEVSAPKNSGDIFGRVSYYDEAKSLRILAGKLYYKAQKETDEIKAGKLRQVSKLILNASDVLKAL
jgi:hypothetical protein